LHGDDGAVVDVAPGEVVAAGDVVELVAEVAVANWRRSLAAAKAAARRRAARRVRSAGRTMVVRVVGGMLF